MKNRPLVALSSAAIVAVYTAGYVRTRAAAERFDQPAEPRRPARPISPNTSEAPRPEGRVAIAAPTPTPDVVARPRVPQAATSAPQAAPPAAAPVNPPSAPAQDLPAAADLDAASVQGL